MAIVCIEGPPAVGKTTVSLELQDTYGAYVISDGKRENGNGMGQFEEQIERWRLAIEKEKEYKLVILDGDIFHPLLKHWLKGSTEKEAVKDVYQHAFLERNMGFPDRYYVLAAGVRTVRRRKNRDLSQWRWNFEEDYALFSKERDVYEGLAWRFPGMTREVEAYYEQETAQQIVRHLPVGPWDRYNLEKFQAIREK